MVSKSRVSSFVTVVGLMIGLMTMNYPQTVVAGESENAIPPAYADPKDPALPQTDMQVSLSDTALVITDPQVDFLTKTRDRNGSGNRSC